MAGEERTLSFTQSLHPCFRVHLFTRGLKPVGHLRDKLRSELGRERPKEAQGVGNIELNRGGAQIASVRGSGLQRRQGHRLHGEAEREMPDEARGKDLPSRQAAAVLEAER